ncbi:MAG: ABC transporter permease, partial [Cyclobacteriaceae bacterium]|nr:ABC transporter permease [Cyclobacteriaceae bacterium]
MLKNYIVVTLRNLRKNITYSFINIAGLSVGIACTMLISLWIFDELSFDTFQPKADRLFQVRVNAHFDGKINSWTSVPQPTYEAMKTEDSNIANTVITDWGGDHLFTVGDNRINKRAYYVGLEFLEMFQFELVKGDASNVLDDPSSIVITESMAKILFGDQDPINQTIRVNNANELKVTGVLKDIPKNSTFQFDCLMTWEMKRIAESWVKRSIDQWDNYSFQVFLELNDAANKGGVENSIRDLLTRKGQTDMKREFMLHNMLRWRLYSNFVDGKEARGMADYVQMFTIIAVFVMVIACINFMNLATARSERRAREVGIRKSVGSRRYDLILQFLGESVFLAFVAFVIALVLTHLALPFYNQLVDKELFIDYQSQKFLLFAFGLIAITGIVSGSYPALYLSSFQPSKVLKGKVQVGKSASIPRKVLVTLQFGF